jgi:ADP-heptose:LPS heptosyltransferase
MINFKKDNPHILLTRTDHIRDVLLMLPMVAALRQKYPEATISLLVDRQSYHVVKSYHEIDKIFLFDSRRHKRVTGFFRLARQVQNDKIDAVVLVYPRFFLALLFFYLMVPVRIGTSRRFYSFLFNYRVKMSRRQGSSHETTYNLHLLLPFDINAQAQHKLFPQMIIHKDVQQEINNWLAQNKIRDFLIIEPFNQTPGPQWPLGYAEDLIYMLAKKQGIDIVLIDNSGQEEAITELIQRSQKNLRGNIHGRIQAALGFNPEKLMELMRQSHLVISNYHGCHYIAVSIGTPAVVLFPVSSVISPYRYAPYGPAEYTAMVPNLPTCHKCDLGNCPYNNCLSYISPEMVYEEVVTRLPHHQGQETAKESIIKKTAVQT